MILLHIRQNKANGKQNKAAPNVSLNLAPTFELME